LSVLALASTDLTHNKHLWRYLCTMQYLHAIWCLISLLWIRLPAVILKLVLESRASRPLFEEIVKKMVSRLQEIQTHLLHLAASRASAFKFLSRCSIVLFDRRQSLICNSNYFLKSLILFISVGLFTCQGFWMEQYSCLG
jgi:hypothetical protein